MLFVKFLYAIKGNNIIKTIDITTDNPLYKIGIWYLTINWLIISQLGANAIRLSIDFDTQPWAKNGIAIIMPPKINGIAADLNADDKVNPICANKNEPKIIEANIIRYICNTVISDPLFPKYHKFFIGISKPLKFWKINPFSPTNKANDTLINASDIPAATALAIVIYFFRF